MAKIMKPVGVFGGSFDPIHFGHLITTTFVYEFRNLEKVIFIPNNISPLKTDTVPISAMHRLNMIKLAIEQYPFFECSDIEIKSGEISYTYKTLLELKKQYSNIELIIGYDNLIVFDKWAQPDKIVELAKLIVMKRKTDIVPTMQHKYFNLASVIDTPTVDISSSEIRNKIRKRKSIEYLVPEKVKDYILKNDLYK
jgi:nicotinate-nucleotide adenylyltransferase